MAAKKKPATKKKTAKKKKDVADEVTEEVKVEE